MRIYLGYISKMYSHLFSMCDDDLDDFHINDESCRAKLFDAMRVEFEMYGPVSNERVLNAIDFILSSSDVECTGAPWCRMPLQLDEVEDKPEYLRTLYQKLAEYEPPQNEYGADAQLISDLHNINVRF